MFLNAFQFVIESIFRFFILMLLMRFMMQVARIPFHLPLGHLVLKTTNWLVLRLRKVVRAWGGYDVASLIGGVLLGGALHAVIHLIRPGPSAIGPDNPVFWIALLLYGLLELIRLTLYGLMGAVIVQAVLSWSNPYHPLAGVMRKLTDPLLRPIQRILPPIGNVDLSPLILLLLFQVLLMAPVLWMDQRLALLLRFGA